MCRIKQILTIFIISVMLFSCGNNVENREMNEYVSAFLNENPSITLFGKVDVSTLLDDADYKTVPKFGEVIHSVKKDLVQMINEKSAVYYAVEGPFNEEGPAAVYGFVDVTKSSDLEQKLTKYGFDFEKSGDFSYTVNGDMCIGISKDLAVFISRPNEYVAEDELSKAFDKCKGDLSEGKVNDILAQKGDVVLGMSIASLYATSNTELSNLSEEKQNKLKELVNDSYTQTTFQFEDGEAIIETKNLFSTTLKEKMFFKSDKEASILSKLGQGEAKFGLSTNLDINKLESFINEYSPNGINDLTDLLGGPASLAMMYGGKKPLSGLLNGDLAVVGVGEINGDGTMIPQFNFYIGLGKNGKMVAEQFSGFLSNGTMTTKLDSKGISGYSSTLYAPMIGKKILLPDGAVNFGKKGITAFVNFEGLNVESFDLEGAGNVVKIIKYISFEMDENGSRICVKAKKGGENILKQSMDFFFKELEGKVGAI